MKVNKQKYVLITAEAEPNIAVIDVGLVDIADVDSSNKIADTIQSKLQQVLEEHFDEEFEIKEVNIYSSTPIGGTARVCTKHQEEFDGPDRIINIDETWVY